MLVCSFTAGRDRVEGSNSFAAGTEAEHAEGTHAGAWAAAGGTSEGASPPRGMSISVSSP
jgi:hypothetical protein